MFYSDGVNLMDSKILAAALFLPLFPLSILFNVLFEGLRKPLPRIVVLMAWPQIGAWLLQGANSAPPDWAVHLALATSLLYGFRALVLRELTHWISFLAISSWSLLWLIVGFFDNTEALHLLALGVSLPLAILTLLGGQLEKKFGASYAGLYNGLGHAMPRFSGVFVFTILAILATPVFPGFTTMTAAFLEVTKASLAGSIMLCLIWLTWGWAGSRLIQGFIIGKEHHEEIEDISSGLTWLYALILTGLAAFGIFTLGQLS
jgi:NADH:ubiquinone oxidoreductase subunit 4 (subunit M)